MDKHTATEQAFKNGFGKGYADGKPKWISVKERLPENREDVLLCRKWWNEIRNPQMGWYNDVSGCWFDLSNREIHNVTHWMPLPEPPEE